MFLHDWLLTGDATYWMTVSANFSAAHTQSVRDPGALGGLARDPLPPDDRPRCARTRGCDGLVEARPSHHRARSDPADPGDRRLPVRPVESRDLRLGPLPVPLRFGFGVRRGGGFCHPTSRRTVALEAPAPGRQRDRHDRCGRCGNGSWRPVCSGRPAVERQVAAQRSASANLQAAEPILRATLSPSSTTLGAPPKLVVPALLSSVATVDLDLRIPDVSELRLGPDGGLDPRRLRDGQIIYHDANEASESLAQTQLEAVKRSRSVHSTSSPSPRTRRPGGGYTPSSERREQATNPPHGRAGRTNDVHVAASSSIGCDRRQRDPQ